MQNAKKKNQQQNVTPSADWTGDLCDFSLMLSFLS